MSVSTSSALVSRARVSFLLCALLLISLGLRSHGLEIGLRPGQERRQAEAPVEAPDEADEARENEEMIDLLDFLGGSGAT